MEEQEGNQAKISSIISSVTIANEPLIDNAHMKEGLYVEKYTHSNDAKLRVYI